MSSTHRAGVSCSSFCVTQETFLSLNAVWEDGQAGPLSGEDRGEEGTH